MKLICAADIHLGRVPSRIPVDLPVDASDLTPAAAWRSLVDATLAEGADALLLAGDVVEDRRDFYEAYADLEAGVARLRAADIPVFAVSGNHDVEVLPRLADRVEGVHLLGRAGEWECVPLEVAGRRIRILGWSFPSAQVTRSPLETSPAEALDAAGSGPVVGLLHGDLDGASPYAPVRRSELADAPVDVWLLGHVHRPDDFAGGRPIGYLGSLTACDPGEAGVRGAWRLTVVPDAPPRLERIPLAPLRYADLPLPLDGLTHPDGVADLVLDGLDTALREAAHADAGLRAMAFRLVFTGRTPLLQDVRHRLAQEDPVGASAQAAGRHAFVHAWRVEAQPAVDLAEIAEGTDPVAIVARTLATVRGPDGGERRALLRDLASRLAAVDRRKPFRDLAPAWSEDEMARRLEGVALRALDELLAQRRGESP